jgi:hypothetical protein
MRNHVAAPRCSHDPGSARAAVEHADRRPDHGPPPQAGPALVTADVHLAVAALAVVPPLTPRERGVRRLTANGASGPEIAA